MKQFVLINLLCLLSFFVFSGCRSKTVVQRFPTANTNQRANGKSSAARNSIQKMEGVSYQLPLTEVKASVPMKKTKLSPGKYGDFTPCFFDPEEAAERTTEESVKFEVKPPTFSAAGVPDPEQIFVVKTKGGYFESKSLLLTYSPNKRTLSEGAAESKNEGLEFALASVKTAVGIGAKVLTAGAGAPLKLNNLGIKSDIPDKSDPERNFPDCYAKGFKYLQEVTQQQKERLEEKRQRATSPVERMKLDEKISQLGLRVLRLGREYAAAQERAQKMSRRNQNAVAPDLLYLDFLKAAKAADQLKSLQESLETPLDSPANVAAEVYKQRRADTDKKIAELTALFFGEKVETPWTGEFSFRPSESLVFKTIFVYSKAGGICVNDAFGKTLMADKIVIPKELQYEGCQLTDQSLVQAQLQAVRIAEDDSFINRVRLASRQTENSNEKQGWYFRIPAQATVTMIECAAGGATQCALKIDNALHREKMMIAQFGAVVSLPAASGGRSGSSSIVLDETTGALKNFKVTSTSTLDKAMLETVEKTADTVINTGDPLTKKKRELDLLKTQNEINEERKKLSNSNSSSDNP